MDPTENFYLLLDLDPDRHTAWADVEPVLKKKRAEWSSRSNHPRDGIEANRCLGLVGRMLSELQDNDRRKAHADAARGLAAARKAQVTAALDGLIALAGKKGFLTPDEVKTLANQGKQGANRWAEADVTARVAAAGLAVKAAAPPPPADPERIETGVQDDIRQKLALLGKADLYEFLGAPRGASVSQLKALADAEYQATRLEAVKTAQVTARGDLAGHAQNQFGTEAQRKKYDATLRWLELEEVRKEAAFAAVNEVIPVDRLELLVQKGKDRGIDRDRVVAAVREVARQKGWGVEVRDSGAVKVPTAGCGSCGALNDEGTPHCRRCRRPLRVKCPKCATDNPTDAKACGNGGCRFPIADMPLAEPRVDMARRVAQTDPPAARRQLAEALTFWPNHPQAVQLLADLDRRDAQEKADRDRRDQEARRLAGAVDAARARREYLAAQAAVAALQQFAPQHPGIPGYRKEIDDALAAAGAHAKRAQALLQQGKTDDAIDAFADAARTCADLPAARDGLAKCPPDPPPGAAATATAASVALSWPRSPSRGAVGYVVVRKAGSQPTRPDDGQEVARTAALAHTDPGAEPGRAYWYAVFADRGGVCSPRPAVAGPVVRLAEVTDLRTATGDGKVTLTWAAPANARGFEVWRGPGAPPARGQGNRVTGLIGPTATDTGLANGVAVGYRVIALYTGPDGKEAASGGATAHATPAAPPRPVADLRITRDGSGQFDAVWSRPPTGDVQVYRVPDPAAARFRPGQLLAPHDLAGFGPPLQAAGPAVVRGRVEPAADVHLLPVTVLGSTAVAGHLVSRGWVEDVPAVQAESTGADLRVVFDFPPGFELAVVAYRTDRVPDGPADPAARAFTWTRAQNQANGAFRCPAPDAERAYLAVYTALNRNGEMRYAGGRTAVVAVRGRRRVRYTLARHRTVFLVASGDLILTVRPDGPTDLPELVLVSRPDGYPLSPETGTEVVRVPPAAAAPARPLVRRFADPGLADLRYARLFPADPSAAGWLELIPG